MIDLTNPIQDGYQGRYSHCYGCGANNTHGLQLKSRWDGLEAVAAYVPEKKYNGVEDFVYGGLIASLIDCHAMATAAAAVYDGEADKLPRFVTGTLSVKYLNPTPLTNAPLKLCAKVKDIKGRKVTVVVELSVNNIITAEGNVVAFEIPASMT